MIDSVTKTDVTELTEVLLPTFDAVALTTSHMGFASNVLIPYGIHGDYETNSHSQNITKINYKDDTFKVEENGVFKHVTLMKSDKGAVEETNMERIITADKGESFVINVRGDFDSKDTIIVVYKIPANKSNPETELITQTVDSRTHQAHSFSQQYPGAEFYIDYKKQTFNLTSGSIYLKGIYVL